MIEMESFILLVFFPKLYVVRLLEKIIPRVIKNIYIIKQYSVRHAEERGLYALAV